MIDQIKEAIAMFGEICERKYTSSAGKYLFNVDDEISFLEETRSDIFTI